jgi:hypothetical protein
VGGIIVHQALWQDSCLTHFLIELLAFTLEREPVNQELVAMRGQQIATLRCVWTSKSAIAATRLHYERQGSSMKRIAALTAAAVGLVLVSSSYADVTLGTYRVSLISNAEQSFIDCYRFDQPNPGDLTIDLLPGGPVTYRHGQLDAVGESFKAVSRPGQMRISFAGTDVTVFGQMRGEAVNAAGSTWVFVGTRVDKCEPFSETAAPYGTE